MEDPPTRRNSSRERNRLAARHAPPERHLGGRWASSTKGFAAWSSPSAAAPSSSVRARTCLRAHRPTPSDSIPRHHPVVVAASLFVVPRQTVGRHRQSRREVEPEWSAGRAPEMIIRQQELLRGIVLAVNVERHGLTRPRPVLEDCVDRGVWSSPPTPSLRVGTGCRPFGLFTRVTCGAKAHPNADLPAETAARLRPASHRQNIQGVDLDGHLTPGPASRKPADITCSGSKSSARRTTWRRRSSVSGPTPTRNPPAELRPRPHPRTAQEPQHACSSGERNCDVGQPGEQKGSADDKRGRDRRSPDTSGSRLNAT